MHGFFVTSTRPVIRRAVQWANHIALGKSDKRQTLYKAKFVDGGTVGPVSHTT